MSEDKRIRNKDFFFNRNTVVGQADGLLDYE